MTNKSVCAINNTMHVMHSIGVHGACLQLQMKQSITCCLVNIDGNTGTITNRKFLAKSTSSQRQKGLTEYHCCYVDTNENIKFQSLSCSCLCCSNEHFDGCCKDVFCGGYVNASRKKPYPSHEAMEQNRGKISNQMSECDDKIMIQSNRNA